MSDDIVWSNLVSFKDDITGKTNDIVWSNLPGGGTGGEVFHLRLHLVDGCCDVGDLQAGWCVFTMQTNCASVYRLSIACVTDTRLMSCSQRLVD